MTPAITLLKELLRKFDRDKALVLSDAVEEWGLVGLAEDLRDDRIPRPDLLWDKLRILGAFARLGCLPLVELLMVSGFEVGDQRQLLARFPDEVDQVLRRITDP